MNKRPNEPLPARPASAQPPKTKKRGSRIPEAADRPSGPGRGRSSRAKSAAPSRSPGHPGQVRALPPRGPPTNEAGARASPRAHCARSRPRRRLRLLTLRRARRGHANEPTVSAAPRRAGANCCRALERRRRPPLLSFSAQAHCSPFFFPPGLVGAATKLGVPDKSTGAVPTRAR